MLAPVLFPNADKLVIEAPDPVTASFPRAHGSSPHHVGILH
ncbi:hypothetical protein GQ55_1G160500 [Panicum hallii var. hallii]|uniref:Uncharacterized protein n=1 Tax=Panicum hallii var. hallii TaxID=1504633 RepID=A0A2T7F5K5_9POAL|nr:hypothetical protein GQ55_1G160500 [Panicum hallii var. hallii]